MGDPKGFLKIKRRESGYRPVEERVHDWGEVERQLPEQERKLQAARCMDCGVPFCHWGCPIGNIMPEWQDRIFNSDWEAALDMLQETNNFPEFTGRVCPAPCEASCVLALNDESVTIRQNELAVIEKAFQEGYVKPQPPEIRTGKKVAVIGGGPAGLACADLLNRAGHSVILYEAEDSVGGYLRFGIPDFKLEKGIIDRRINIMEKEGIVFRTGTYVGKDVSIKQIRDESDAVCLTIGARKARDLDIKGRELKGVHFAMEFLAQQNRVVRGDRISETDVIAAFNKNVVVIGGGDTGSDCVGSANRRGAKSITQIELMPMPPRHRTNREPWPLWPRLLKTSSSHEEGCDRMWNVLTREFMGEGGAVKKIKASKVNWLIEDDGKMTMTEIPETQFELEADLVLLAMGFEHVVHEGLVRDLDLACDARGNIKVDENCMTSIDGVFSAGDAMRGASLVVWAIHDGRNAAAAINRYLKK
ncbi:MAG: glutamate synthase [Spirochaetae bacterium HGW-Spirochaetae-1]|jgi:glutamate synthase (NADPH/NADH) small chain|nr:MAG: glutamate synthase [Spirochaetae bacterium HGW-Spirochaetae-1]